MDIPQSPADAFVDFFAAGAKTANDFKYGIELEHFIINELTGFNINYDEPGGAREILDAIAPVFREQLTEQGHLIALANDEFTVSLEPGGQIECSVTAAKELSDIENRYRHFRKLVDPIAKKSNTSLVNCGYLPKSKLSDITLIPKSRYDCMDKHFQSSGTMGRFMMRATCACHVTIDYADETDFIEKYRCAYILSPIITYLTKNADSFEGNAYAKHGLRYHIWQHTDNARTGIVPGVFDDDFCFRTYAGYVLNQAAILIPQGDVYVPTNQRVYEILENDPGNEDLRELYMSLVFPDVRLRQYIEIRSGDSMPFERAIGYLGFIKGLFTNFGALKAMIKAWNITDPVNDLKKAYDSLQSVDEPMMYGLPVKQITKELWGLADACTAQHEKLYLRNFIYPHYIQSL